jgi:uncharacterized protein
MSERRDFVVAISKLLADPSAPLRVSREGYFDDLFVTSSRIQPDAPAGFEGQLEAAHPGVMVRGRVYGSWQGECVRCLEEAQGEISTDVNEIFEPKELINQYEEPDEIYTYEFEEIDLAPLVCDALVLELPVVPLCREDCHGLCVQCGINLNEVAAGRASHTCDDEPPILREIAIDLPSH